MLDGGEKPVTFASWTLSQTEWNYSQIEKETPAIIYLCYQKVSSILIWKTFYYEVSVESDCLIWGNRVIILFHLRNKILTELHENHPGIVRMKALACSYVWWAGMDIEIENTVKSCNACQINHIMSAKAPAHPWEKTTSPWVRLHIDFAGPFLDKMFFIIYDSFSKWIKCYSDEKY